MKKALSTITLLALVTLLSNCKKDKTTASDATLFEKSNTTTGFYYYKNNTAILESSKPSAHNKYFRMRYNKIAFDAMTDNGKLPIGKQFPEGSLVVKELYDSKSGSVVLLAVMSKETGNENLASGWLWGEYSPSGSTVYSISKKGSACVSCHSTDARDYTRVFDLF
jgi:hypothetical protein